MKSGIAIACILSCTLATSRLFAQAEYSPLDSGGLIVFAGGSKTEGAGAVGGGLGANLGGHGDFSVHYAHGSSHSIGSNQFGVQATFFLGRRHARSNIFLAIRAAVDQVSTKQSSWFGTYNSNTAIYTPSVSAIFIANSTARTSIVPSLSIGSHFSKYVDGQLFVQMAGGIRFLSSKGKCFYLEPGVGMIGPESGHSGSSQASAFISLGWLGSL